MFSAYDLKKIIPRAVFALVAAQLSWSLMNIMVDSIGILGDGIKELILAPFPEELVGITLSGNTDAIFGAAVGVVAVGAALGLVPIFATLLGAIVGVFIGFGIILFRRLVLVALVMIAPIAIALSVFPQTEKWAKQWFEWFFKLLLMYPFIMAMFAMSQVAAGLMSELGMGDDILNAIYQLGAIVVLVVPYFLVGTALKFAGGAISKVAGAINNPNKGFIDRTKKWEGAKVAQNRSGAKAGSRYADRNAFTRGINRTLRSGANPRSVLNTSADDRDGRVLGALNGGVGRLLSTHESAKTLDRDESAILAGGASKGQLSAHIQAMAKDRAKKNGTTESQELATLNSKLRSAEQKVGGDINATTQLHALQLGAQEGHIDAAAAAAGIGSLVGGLATSDDQKGRLAQTLYSQLDDTFQKSEKGGGLFGQSVSRAAGVAGTSGPTQDEVEGLFRGPDAIPIEKLGSASSDDLSAIGLSKQRMVADQIDKITAATSTPQDRLAASKAIEQQRADLVIAQHAAMQSQAGSPTSPKIAAAYESMIEAVDAQVTAARATTGAHTAALRGVEANSLDQARLRIKPIP